MTGKKTILIVDDDADYSTSISCFLAANGYNVLEARDGRQGLMLAKLHHPLLILMDIMMDERTEGFFTVQEIRRVEELKDTPVFVLSALYSQVPDFEIHPARAWAGHDEFLPKPVDLDLLLNRIHERIGDPQHEDVETAQG